MDKRLIQYKYLLISVIAIMGIGVLIYLNFLYTSNYSGGKYFQTQWIAARGFWSEGLSPYADNLLYKIQVSAYGRPAMAGEYEFRFMYPYFSLLILAPFGLIKDFMLARAVWMALLELCVVAIFLVSMNLVDWKPKRLLTILLFLFSITFYHNIRAIIDGNLIIVVTLFLLLALVAIRDRRDETAGFLLAFTLLELKFILPVLVLIFIYLLLNRRTKTLWYFLGSLLLLAGFSFLLAPTWLSDYGKQLWLSITENPANSFLSVMRSTWGLPGTRFAFVIMGISATTALFEWYFVKIAPFKRFLWILFLTIAIIQYSGLPAETSNFVLLFPGLILAMKLIFERWKNYGEVVVFILISVIYMTTWIMFFLLDNQRLYLEPALFFAFTPVIEVILLYWSRWWVIRGRLQRYLPM